jgi:SAM-dependent methyltransferase
MEKIFEQKRIKEENPFEDERVAKEWINSVENEKDMGRDREIYPRLEKWINDQPSGLVIEIGSGQGICSDKLGDFKGAYVGVEPSKTLTERAKELYKKEQCEFVVGDAYNLPIESEKAEAGFSVMVWFHLENLDKASSELARILKSGGKFFIITANPDAVELWESWFSDATKEGKKIVGKVNIPVNPLSKNIFYQHSKDEVLAALKDNGLVVEKIDDFGLVDGENIFFSIEGKKL